jgi:hypothetical protein
MSRSAFARAVPHTPGAYPFRNSPRLLNLRGVLLIPSNILRSSMSSNRSSISRYSSISRITAVGLPSRRTISGVFLLCFLAIFVTLTISIPAWIKLYQSPGIVKKFCFQGYQRSHELRAEQKGEGTRHIHVQYRVARRSRLTSNNPQERSTFSGVVKPFLGTQAEKKPHLPLEWWSFWKNRFKHLQAIAISFSGYMRCLRS